MIDAAEISFRMPSLPDFVVFPNLVVLASVIVGVGILLSLLVIWGMALMLLRPPRMTDGKAMYVLRRLSPGDLNLEYKTLTFNVRDEATGGKIDIAAWFIPNEAAAGRCVVLVHGYADAKVGSIAWAPEFHQLGLNVLAIDLRGHGESGGSATTGGYYERHDIVQVVEQLREQLPNAARQVVLFGNSLGGGVVLAAAALHDDIGGLILDSIYPDYGLAARRHAKRMGAPGAAIQIPAIWLAQWLSKSDYNAVAPTTLLPEVRCPTLLIQSGADEFVTAEDREALAAAAAESDKVQVWTAENAEHCMGLRDDTVAYRARVKAFVEELFQ